MKLPMLTDLNKLEDWILKQEDCWLSDTLVFHKGNLFRNFCEENQLSFTTFDQTIERDRIIRIIALAEVGARRKRMQME